MMKTKVLVLISAFIILFSCEKDDTEPTLSTFTDTRDGKVYKIVTIGTQTWFAENFNYETANSTTYNNLLSNGEIYGRLYSWNDALDACPTGWHLPSLDEWLTLIDYLGGSEIAGGKLKETGTVHWESPNTDATNSSNFTALPGGFYYSGDNSFIGLGEYADFWMNTEYETGYAWKCNLYNLDGEASTNVRNLDSGLSVRYIQD